MRQRGFTLLEILLALAIGSLLLTGALLTIPQIIVTTSRSNSQVVVLDEVNRAALQLKKDLQSRDTANISAGSDAITLYWVNNTDFEGEGPQTYTITYNLSGTELIRTSTSTTSIVARQIDSIRYSDNGTYINVVITATSSNFPPKSETINFSVCKRMEEMEW